LINIISGCTITRFQSETNHRAYAAKHGYSYEFDSKQRELKSKYDHKMFIILEQPIDDEWCFWIDDDAFFMQLDQPLEQFLEGIPSDTQMIFPKSPVNPLGGWTYLSAGNFFFRRSQLVHDFFERAIAHDVMMIKQWWDDSKYGLFTKGDQDKIVYELAQSPEVNAVTKIVGYDTFNFRPYHFKESSDEHFLVHFATPGISKADSMADFQQRFGFKDLSLVGK